MCYYMKDNDLVRLNLHCNRLTNSEAISFWKDDRKEYNYKNFCSDTYKYIENTSSEVIFLLLKNTKNFIYMYIQNELELNIFDTNDFNDFIYYENENTYKTSYFFKVIEQNSNEFSSNKQFITSSFIRTTNIIEILPSCWIKECIIELFHVNNITKKFIFIDSNNRKVKIYKNDPLNIKKYLYDNDYSDDSDSSKDIKYKNFTNIQNNSKHIQTHFDNIQNSSKNTQNSNKLWFWPKHISLKKNNTELELKSIEKKKNTKQKRKKTNIILKFDDKKEYSSS